MKNSQFDDVVEILTKNSSTPNAVLEKALNESSKSGDIASYAELIKDVIQRTRIKSSVNEITTVAPSTTPTGKIPVMSSKMVGKTGQGTDDIIVLRLADATNFSVDGDITSLTGAEGSILYKEDNYVLVKVTLGDFAVTDNVDNVNPYVASETTVEALHTASYGVGHILPGYVGPYSTANAETVIANRINWKLNLLETNATSRILVTPYTQELLFDMARQYREYFPKKIADGLSNIITMSEEIECFNYMNSIATKYSPLQLNNSYGVATDLKSVYIDIVSRINKLKAKIGTATNMGGKFFVVASSGVVAAIETVHNLTPYKVEKEFESINSRIAGILPNGVLVVEDPYSLDDYFTVGSAGIKGMDNAGIFYVPYNFEIVMTTDSDTLQEVLGVRERCSFERNIMDTKIGTAESDFFHYVPVDFSNLTNY